MIGYEQCRVCGAAIGENNHTGIGGGCMANIVKPAIKDCFLQTMGLELWITKAKALQTAYIECFKGTKFRSAFKKSFYESMSTAERISKKQFEIMIGQMSYSYEHSVQIPDFKEIFIKMINAFDPHSACSELYMERLNIHKKLYLSGRKNADYVITQLPKNIKSDTPEYAD